MLPLAVVAAGGAIGAVARYQVAVWMQTRWSGPFPAGTVAVNLVGCFVIGLLAGMLESRPTLSPMVRLFVAAGLLGSFTTFSTFGLETIAAIARGHLMVALANVGVSVVVGLAAVAAGIWLGRAW